MFTSVGSMTIAVTRPESAALFGDPFGMGAGPSSVHAGMVVTEAGAPGAVAIARCCVCSLLRARIRALYWVCQGSPRYLAICASRIWRYMPSGYGLSGPSSEVTTLAWPDIA